MAIEWFPRGAGELAWVFHCYIMLSMAEELLCVLGCMNRRIW